mgnify:CR=1 FL=1
MAKPNVILFFTDQQRWDTLGLHGNRDGLTPNLDRLARQGTFFREATTPQPVCGPARSCIQTGQYATTTGVWRNGPGLKKGTRSLARCFREGGYRTAYIGKWHLSENTGEGPVPKRNRAGYEHWLAANAVELVSGPYSSVLWNEDGEPVRLPGYRVDAQTDAAIRQIEAFTAKGRKPFLMGLSFLEPHHQNTDDSYPAPHGMEEILGRPQIPPDLRALGGSTHEHWRGYCGMIKRLDEALGRLMDALHSLGQAENTIIVFLSDHGCHFKTRNSEYKRSPHESSVRIPLALWGPGWNGGGEHTAPVSLVDLMPSLLESAGLPVPDEVEGTSFFGLTRGKPWRGPEEAFFQFGDGFLPPGRGLRTSRWKYAVTAAGEATGQPAAEAYHETHLYDLQADPHELRNLVDEPSHAEVRKHLRRRLRSRCRRVESASPKIQPAPQKDSSGQRTVEYPGL